MFHPARRQHGVHSPLRRTDRAGPLAAALDLNTNTSRGGLMHSRSNAPLARLRRLSGVWSTHHPPKAQQVNYPRLILRFALRYA